MTPTEPVQTKLNDTSLMPFGTHKGKRMINVPADYLLWLTDQPWMKTGSGFYALVREYIADNLDVIKKENKKAKR
jgi:uncharacterized protein (DUF3820 family)